MGPTTSPFGEVPQVIWGNLVRTPWQKGWPFSTLRVWHDAVEMNGLFVHHDRIEREACARVAIRNFSVPLMWCYFVEFDLVDGTQHPRRFTLSGARKGRRVAEVFKTHGWPVVVLDRAW